ncbi:SseB family protein [Leucobacter insecticola]|uniref:SseB family protein n=1 Tax=Leucobacter insecticola TaxID=2714934 RepID=A0A6G8FKL4_9MICO|nr:SseB family protein [Leucobacter insecticola]QIM16894.1 SseB family protein [Leucobacter insecticola]
MAIKKLPSTGDKPRTTGVPDSLIPGGKVDSAGFPWAGRTFDHHETAFADDSGETPEQLRIAVAQLRSAAAGFQSSEAGSQAAALGELAAAHTGVIQALATSRLLVPLLTEAGDIGVTPEGKTVEKTQELSIVTVAGPDGRRVMPVFSSTDAMRSWNPSARPIPVPGPQLALAAAQEETDLIIIDPGSAEGECGVRRPALRAMATGEPVQPAWADEQVRAAFAAALSGEERVEAIALMPGDPEGRLLNPETEVHLMLAASVTRDMLDDVIVSLQQRFAVSEVIAERVDSMRIVPHATATER